MLTALLVPRVFNALPEVAGTSLTSPCSPVPMSRPASEQSNRVIAMRCAEMDSQRLGAGAWLHSQYTVMPEFCEWPQY